MASLGALTFRCSRCEWPFSLSAATVTSPAVPSSTVAATNSTGTVVAVAISGGTLTSVVVNGTQVGTTAGTYLVPAGGTISITYSAAPSWTWALPVTNGSVSTGGAALPFASGGTSFAVGQVLIVDPSGSPDLVTVTGAPTGTSVPVAGLSASHNSGVSVTVAQAAPALSGVEAVPQTTF